MYYIHVKKQNKNWQITMNSEKSVQSIKKPNTLFPVNLLEDVSLSESDIKEGNKFLSACATGEAEFVKKILESFNTSVLNKIDDSYRDWTGIHYACSMKKLQVVKLLSTAHVLLYRFYQDKISIKIG
jgi:ankyrin repeat protein